MAAKEQINYVAPGPVADAFVADRTPFSLVVPCNETGHIIAVGEVITY